MISQSVILELIPPGLRERFQTDILLADRAVSTVARYATWFDDSGLPFFRHYTDHTARHSLDVFRTAMELIPETSYPAVSAADLSALLITSFAHDAGMHLTEDQFLILIQDDEIPDNKLDDHSWKVTWRDFIREARRFNQTTLQSIFGDTNPVRDIPSDVMDFSNRDRLLIGEFIRRYHPRLAHDISTRLSSRLGLPNLTDLLTPAEKDLFGVIARSHGLPIRDLFPFLDEHFDKRTYQNIHVVYVMAVLRIADYAQLQSARAPEIHDKIHSVASPVSQKEWRVHQSVVNIHQSHDDPDAIYVDSKPTNVIDLERVRAWLRDLQQELDTSWAVLGEIYGRHHSTSLNLLGLQIRRVRSTILDGKKRYAFLPMAYSFKVAEAEMLSLLLAPLYGDHPFYGLRELIQNARDAILERPQQEPKFVAAVSVTIDTRPQSRSVVVSDTGSGMTSEILGDYFLTAGASYRSSQDWKERHILDNGSSKIARSGRFGVGALAAFLLGDRLTVVTRHHSESSGLKFDCTLHDKNIEIREVETEIGTTIVAHADEQTLKKLVSSANSWISFFNFTDVDLEIKVIHLDGTNVKIERSKPIFKKNSEKFEFTTEKFKRVSGEFVSGGAAIHFRTSRDFVNGIAIGSIYRENEVQFGTGIYSSDYLTHPVGLPGYSGTSGHLSDISVSLQIEDTNSQYPVNLPRTASNSRDKDVIDEINKNLFELYKSELTELNNKISKLPAGSRETPVLNGLFGLNVDSVIFSNGKAVPNDIHILSNLGIRYIFRAPSTVEKTLSVSKKFPDVGFSIGRAVLTGKTSVLNYLRDLQLGSQQIKGKCSVVVQDKDTILGGVKGGPLWMGKITREAESIRLSGNERLILEFGAQSSELKEKIFDIIEEMQPACAELHYSDTTLMWQRWHQFKEDEKSTFGETAQV